MSTLSKALIAMAAACGVIPSAAMERLVAEQPRRNVRARRKPRVLPGRNSGLLAAEEIRAHNAAVDEKNAAKRARQAARRVERRSRR